MSKVSEKSESFFAFLMRQDLREAHDFAEILVAKIEDRPKPKGYGETISGEENARKIRAAKIEKALWVAGLIAFRRAFEKGSMKAPGLEKKVVLTKTQVEKELDQDFQSVFRRVLNLAVTSRKVVWLFLEQLRLDFVPALHRLQGRPAAQG